MPCSYSQIVLHSVWSTKYRNPFIDEGIEHELHGIMIDAFAQNNCYVHEIGGTDDHIHVLHTLPRTKSIADVLAAVKSISSGWLSGKGERYEWFEWQDGYGTFSVDYRYLDKIRRYVKNQRAHHAMNGPYKSFEEEYTAILRTFGHEDFTPQYVFPAPPTHV